MMSIFTCYGGEIVAVTFLTFFVSKNCFEVSHLVVHFTLFETDFGKKEVCTSSCDFFL